MALVLTHYSAKSDALRFAAPSVAILDSGVALTSADAPEVKTPSFKDGWIVYSNTEGADFFLSPPRLSDLKLQGLSPNSTAQKPEASTLSDNIKLDTAPLIKLNRQVGPVRRFKVLQQFEGMVTELYEGNTFRADLIDLTDRTRERESAEFSLDDIHPADRELITPGSVFYWIMGFETTPSDYKRVSEIRLRRSPKWSQHEIETITREGQELFDRYTQRERDATAAK